MEFWRKFWWLRRKNAPAHLEVGAFGEDKAKEFLRQRGMKLLVTNFRSGRSEIDLICREGNCLVFVEVKTRSSEGWTRPSRAVNERKKRLLSRAALAYLRLIDNPSVPIRFDIVEVLLEGDGVREIRHLPNSFTLSKPYRYGA